MKKSTQLMITATLVFIALIAGVFLGRNSLGTFVTLYPSLDNTISATETLEDSNSTGKININTADIKQLTLLPGIGTTKATKIVEFREKYGKFTRIDDLINVDGFSFTTIEQIRPYITTGG